MAILKRALTDTINERLKEKVILLSGPRQCGKTTLSKFFSGHHAYLNYDYAESRDMILKKAWNRQVDLVIFDELHKMKLWKSYIKGIYDVEGIPPAILVTGSAKLDTYRKMGDSLAGRFYRFRLYPFDLWELADQLPANTILDRLMDYGGFPEPFLKASEIEYNLWKKSHLDIILRQDLLDLESIRHIPAIETLIQFLRQSVGSPVSYASLARDLQFSPQTVKHWLQILENLYVIFKVTPYSTHIARALLKEPKYYFYDTAYVIGDLGQKFENLVACALLKRLHYLEDTLGATVQLHFCKTKQGHEVDFVTLVNDKKVTFIESKWADHHLSKSLAYFKERFPHVAAVQIVKNLQREKSFPNRCEIRAAETWLKAMPLT